MPFMFNATIVNGMGLTGWLESPPVWKPSGSDTSASNGDVAASGGDLGAHVDVRFEFSDVLWPYSGYLAFYARVKPSAKKSEGIASGTITFTVLSPPGPGETELRRSTVNVPVKFQVVPTPPRAKRVLWSQYHSVRYPPGYIPRDNLEAKNDILDWHGDHPHTNYHGMYDALRDKGYFLEILGSPLTVSLFSFILVRAISVLTGKCFVYSASTRNNTARSCSSIPRRSTQNRRLRS